MIEQKKKTQDQSGKEGKMESFTIDIEEMGRAGVHFGHQTSKRHPKMTPFIQGVRNSIHLIDLEKTAQFLEGALRFISESISEGKILLFVGTKIQHKNLIKEVAKECGLPYVTERWLGGTFTNFEIIKKRIEYFNSLKRKKEEGGFEKYTKKESAKLERELRDLERKFGGIKDMTELPDALFVVDMKKDAICVREARAKGVRVIGITDTNIDPSLADYPIPANDDAMSSVKYILDKVKEVILRAKTNTTPIHE